VAGHYMLSLKLLVFQMNIINNYCNYWMKNILIILLLILPILWFVFPAISIGTDNLDTIKYFDNDESILVKFAGKTYSQGLIPMEDGAAYPQLFYYIAGVVLVPFTLLKGVNYQVIVIGLRGFNVLIALFTVIFFYFFTLKYFKKTWIAILCCFLLISTPNYLTWTLNSRPHILALLFALVGLSFCLKMVEENKPKNFWGAVLFSAFAVSTNLLFGVVAIPAIWVASLYNSSKLQTMQLVENLKSKYKLINLIASFIVVAAISFFALGVFVLVKYQGLFYRNKIHGVGDFLQIRNVRMIMILVGILLLAGITWLIINNLLMKQIKEEGMNQRYRPLFIANDGLLSMFYMVCLVSTMFLVLTPTYWLFPLVTAKVLFSQFLATTVGTGPDIGINEPLVNSGRFVWLKMVFEQQLLGIWIGCLFFCYLIYELVFLKKNWHQDQQFLMQRGILWIYIMALMLVLVVFVTHTPHHYLLPISSIMTLFTSFGIVQIVKENRIKTLKWLALVSFILFLAIGIYARATEIVNNRNIRLSGANYTGGESLWIKQ